MKVGDITKRQHSIRWICPTDLWAVAQELALRLLATWVWLDNPMAAKACGEAEMEPKNTVTEDEIRQRAYELWELRGRPEGHDAQFWEQAERELNLGENLHSATANAVSARSGGGSEGTR